ncbi:PTS sugar transporter subunit IIA [Sulfuriferula thiophila]|uniref:PTS sugar transporter subunit IIA n=1 Tax=Sulfuriferula thiophila TaxID=1781211 RepID=UPI000F605C5E|nr:PTS fructose transporter subunit IIA [Sulfuriferula thiophila]
MIGILVVAHGTLGESLIQCATHVLGSRPPLVAALDVSAQTQLCMLGEAEQLLVELDQGDGVLLLSDVYGATPCNTMCRLLVPGKVEGIAGVNLPMLMRAITYRQEPLESLVKKAVTGGQEGILYISPEFCDAATGR